MYSIILFYRLEFLENLDIISMFSSEGEKVKLSQSISTSAARGAVEKWLLQVQDTMIVSVKDVIEQARDVSTCTCKNVHVYNTTAHANMYMYM
jgi:ABC-type arginine transport system permease subunit